MRTAILIGVAQSTCANSFSRFWVNALAIAITAMVIAPSYGAVGRTEGAFAVTSVGSANYVVPVWSPPGINGLQPNLELTYDSNITNGFLGVGWRISGLSEITRCPATWAQNGTPAPATLGNNTPFCLDGIQLKSASGGYGLSGSTYQAEINTSSRITSQGAYVGGPAYFTVEAKNGLIYEYGNTPDSSVEPITGGLLAYKKWALNKIRDRNGNYIQFNYTEDVANGEHRISNITYPHTASGGGPYYRMDFVPEARPTGDIIYGRQFNHPYRETQRLDRIDVSWMNGGWQLVRKYDLFYAPGPASSRSLITSIQECITGDCLAPTTFSYTPGATSWASETSIGQTINGIANALAIDINGDGRQDLVYPNPSTNTFWFTLSTTSGYSTPQNTTLSSVNGTSSLPLDYNADGRTDLLVPGATNWRVLLSTGSGFSEVSTSIPTTGAGGNAWTADINGDGYDDLLFATGLDTYSSAINVRFGSATGFSASSVAFAPPVGTYTQLASAFGGTFGNSQKIFYSYIQVADFNGDRREDVLIRYRFDRNEGDIAPDWRYYTAVLTSNGTTLGGGTSPLGGSLGEIGTLSMLADVNGDGFLDVVFPSGATWRIGFSKATGSFQLVTTTISSTNSTQARVADWDGDGRSDLIVNVGGVLHYARSNGAGFDAAITTSIPGPLLTQSPRIADVNGDGLADWLYGDSTTNAITRLHNGAAPDLLSSAVDGFGVSAAITYQSLASPSNCYSREGAAPSFPLIAYPGVGNVVCSHTESNGTGGTYTVTYRYLNANVNVQGRGFLGFQRKYSRDNRNNMLLTETFAQDFPYIGMRVNSLSRQPDDTTYVRDVTDTPNNHSYASGSRLPYVSQTVAQDYEVSGPYNGQLVRTTTTNNTVDASSGTITDSTTTTVEASTANGLNAGQSHTERTFHSSLFNDIANWCIGRPSTTQQINSHTLPGGAQVTRTRTTNWNGPYCRPTDIVVESGSVRWQVTTAFSYDTYGNMDGATVTPAAGQGQVARTTSINWGDGRFPQSITNAKGAVTTFGWDARFGARTSVTDPNTLAFLRDFDGFGRLTRETFPDQTKTEYVLSACNSGNSYCGVGDLRSRVDIITRDTSNGVIRTDKRYFDGFGRARYDYSQMLNGGDSGIITTYDALGRIASRSAPFSSADPIWYTSYSYDMVDRPTLIQRQASESDTSTISTQISYQGLRTISTDPLSRSTSTIQDAVGRTIQALDSAGVDTDYEYDAFGNLTRTRDFYGSEIALTYNERGLRMTSSDPDMGNWTYDYFPLGELKSQTDAKGQTSTFTYDELSRPLTRVIPEGAGSITSTFTWGTSSAARNIGELEWMQIAGANITTYRETYAYDSLSRTSQVTYNDGATDHQVNYAYYATDGLLKEVTYPTSTSAFRLRVQYDYQNGLLRRIWNVDNNDQFWIANSTDAWGDVTDATLGQLTNGVTFQTVSSRDRITGTLESRQSTYTSGAISGTVIADLGFTYNKVGMTTGRQDYQRSLAETFAYDNLDRLDFATFGATTRDYSYDARGNVTAKSGAGTTYNYTTTVAGCSYYPHSQPHAVRQVTGGASTLSFCYDQNGNMTSRSGTAISWFANNLPKSIVKDANNSSTFEYSPSGQRWKQVYRTAGSTSTHTYIGSLAERVVGPTTTDWKHYIYANGEAIAVYIRRTDGAKNRYFFTRDQLGGIAATTHSDGTWRLFESFDEFGQRRAATSWSGAPTGTDLTKMNDTTRRGFTFHEHLDSSSLIHMNGRVYDPVIGRFISADPLVQAPFFSQSLNRYSYTFNNPLTFTDPSGFMSFPVRLCIPLVGCIGGDGQAPTSEADRARVQGPSSGRYRTATHGGAGGGGGRNLAGGHSRQTMDRDAIAGRTGSDLWGQWTRVSYAFGYSVADFAMTNVQPSIDMAYSLGNVAQWRGTRRDFRNIVVGAIFSGLAATPGGLAEDAGKDVVYLYRGVRAGHPAFEAARAGRAVPGTIDGLVSAAEHNLGQVSAKSPYTSWTLDLSVARRYAGEDGLILRVPSGASPPGSTWHWEWSPDVFLESEVLLRGVREGCTVMMCVR
jgi:RHS repeat-associated protein